MGTLCENMYTSPLINSWLSIRATGIQCSFELVTGIITIPEDRDMRTHTC